MLTQDIVAASPILYVIDARHFTRQTATPPIPPPRYVDQTNDEMPDAASSSSAAVPTQVETPCALQDNQNRIPVQEQSGTVMS